jgi:hypothetical protein
VYGIEALKRWGWLTWIRADTKTVNRVVSFGAALVIGIGITWEGDFAHGWILHIPPGGTLLAFAFEGLKQGAMQQVLYDGVVDRRVTVASS